MFAADKNKVVWDVLGALRLELANQMNLLDKNEYQFPMDHRIPAAGVV